MQLGHLHSGNPLGGNSHHSPLLDFCFNCVFYVEQDLMQENNYCLISITMVSLWHFPLNNLLKIQSTFWPEGGGVEVKQKVLLLL